MDAWKNLNETAQFVVLLSGGITGFAAVLGLWRKFVRPWLCRVWTNLTGLMKNQAEHHSIMVALNQLRSDMTPVDKQSLRDFLQAMRHEQRLTRSSQYTLMQTMEEGVFVMSKEGSCMWVNRAYCRLTGALPHQVMGFGWLNFLPQQDRDEIKRTWLESVDNEMEYQLRFAYQRPDGTRIPAYAHVLPSRDVDSGEVLEYIGIVQEVKDEDR